jgi:hypothetical protein
MIRPSTNVPDTERPHSCQLSRLALIISIAYTQLSRIVLAPTEHRARDT